MRLGSLLAVAIALVVPGAAHASVQDVYERLGESGLTPAPLVPTTVPRVLMPVDEKLEPSPTIAGRGYSLRLVDIGSTGDAIVVVTGGEFRRMRALLREHRRRGYRAKRTRIRGRRGYVLTRRLGPVARTLAWSERGVVYSVETGTSRRISLADLRLVARGLDRLEHAWGGASADPNSSSEAFAVTTARTISVDVTFEARCTFPGSTEPIVRVGQAGVTLMRRQGSGFAFDVAANRRRGSDDEPWQGTVTGRISPTEITVEVRAAGTIEGYSCDTGTLTLTLTRR